ncbi:hypothetical protein CASFOL_004408 [Castilleja foliolosa]|uniref:Zinc finger BED domain-containing protein RICESLEEPER 2-like n=1 Tax=Castilleja foliolosa TaxID=1961234 RepID=A0ABD3EB59_9LAMI
MDSSSSNMDSDDEEQMLVHDNEGKLRSKKIDPKISRELLAAVVIKHDLPVSFVEYDGIRAWMKYVNPDDPYISKNTLMSEINKTHSDERQKIRRFFASMKSGICLTCDIWTVNPKEKYICLSGQFVDDNWKLSNKILGFDVLPYPEFDSEVALRIMGFMGEWGIDKKVFSLTLDECSSANPTKDFIKKQRGSHGVSLLCEGEFFDIPCLAHTLDTIAQEGLKSIDLILCKIRETVEIVKSSEFRVNIYDGVCLDVPTRWDSTCLMLSSVIKHRRMFSVLRLHEKEFESSPSEEEWDRAEKICEFLELLYETASCIFGCVHPTSNWYFMQVWKIGVMLVENLSIEDTVISDVFRRMKEKFDKYWNQYSTVLACGAVLDPRIKLSMLDFFYSKIESDPIKCQEMITLVKTKLFMIFEHYGNIATEPRSSQPKPSFVKHSPRQMQNGGASKDKRKRIFDEITAYESQVVGKAENFQLVRYLEDPKLKFSNDVALDVLEYWKNHAHIYPDLAIMARAVLAIPITTSASESIFSVGANVLSKYRGWTLPNTVRALVCTRNWLHGYAIDNEESAGNKATLPAKG